MKRIGLGLLMLAGAAMAAIPAVAQTKEKVSVGALAFVSSSPLFIAKERGYFDAEGLDVEIKIFSAAQPIAVAAASGETDFGIGGITAGFYNLAGKGALKIIAAQSREEPGYDFVAYVASKQAYDSGKIRAPKDFAGKTVAITTVGSTFHYNLGKLAEKHGFPLDSVSLKAVQTVPNMASALKGNQVDGIIIVANNAYQLEADGSGKIVGWVHQETPWQLGALFASSKNVASRRPMVEKFVRGYLKGVADYADAYLVRDAAGKRVFGAKAEALLPIMQKWVRPEPTAEQVIASANFIDPKGRLLVKDLHDQVAWYKAQGLVDKEVEARSFIDLSFVQGHLDLPRN